MGGRSQQFETRQSMERSSFEVFHYTSPAEDKVELHHHDFYEIFLLLQGKLDYRVEGRIYRLTSGDLLLISPLEFHQPLITGSDPYERVVLWIDRGYLESLSTPETQLDRCFARLLDTHSNVLHLSAAERTVLMELLETLIRETYSGEYGSELGAQGVFLQLMVELNRVALQKRSRLLSPEESTLASAVLAYINDHYSDELTLETLAHRFFVSKYHLSHEFQRSVGISVYHYIILRRLLVARQMLAGGQSPGSVCHQCGFNDYANFYRAFRKEYGIGPKEYADAER